SAEEASFYQDAASTKGVDVDATADAHGERGGETVEATEATGEASEAVEAAETPLEAEAAEGRRKAESCTITAPEAAVAATKAEVGGETVASQQGPIGGTA